MWGIFWLYFGVILLDGIKFYIHMLIYSAALVVYDFCP